MAEVAPLSAMLKLGVYLSDFSLLDILLSKKLIKVNVLSAHERDLLRSIAKCSTSRRY